MADQDVQSLRGGPFYVAQGQNPQLTHLGVPRRYEALPATKLPMCVLHNNRLAQRFEQPIRAFKHRTFTGKGTRVNVHETQPLALWLLKTWLLSAHPQVKFADGIARDREWAVAPTAVWSWIGNGGAPPPDLSLWLWRRDDEQTPIAPTTVALPRIFHDGVTEACLAYEFGIRTVEVAVAYHPGWRIEHPLERDCHAVRLWPLPDRLAGLDLSELAAVPSPSTSWSDGPTIWFAPQAFTAPEHCRRCRGT